MPAKQALPYGSWPSPVQAQLLTQSGVRLSLPQVDDQASWWLESRPSERGRTVLVRQEFGATAQDMTPANFSVRTKANEYGGGDYHLATDWVYFVNGADQQIYRQSSTEPLSAPEPITRAPASRFADLRFDRRRNRLIAVQETQTEEAIQTTHRLVAIDVSNGDIHTLAEGADFYASPALSPCGNLLAWLSWDHPNMPWDTNQLWLAQLTDAGEVIEPQCISPENCSSFQPLWSPGGELIATHDASDWWNLYRYDRGHWQPLAPMAAEFATPQWVFGMSCYGFIDAHTLLVTYTQQGLWHCATLDLKTLAFTPLPTPFTHIADIACHSGQAIMLAANAHTPEGVWRWREGAWHCDKASLDNPIEPAQLSSPQPVTFPTSQGASAHGFYYPPHNTGFEGPPGAQPPLIVLSHGGPTGATSTALNFKIQYWTSRGFAVLDVNYRGSTGYGRAYRNALRGQWGVYDVDDVCAGAQHLADQGLADAKRLIIKGSSAGGYTVLAALAFRQVFCAGTSLYGIGDLTALATDTHKFESRYLDSLIAPWPAGEAVYRARSPLLHADKLNCPVIFFQGLQDLVVPPNQAQAMVDALVKKGVPTAHITFATEGHGFREAQSIVDQLELELNFYGALFGFTPQPVRDDFAFVTQD